PGTYGATSFPIDKVTGFIANDHDLPTLRAEDPDETDFRIAEFVSSLISDGSTIQLGIGAIPNAVSQALRKRSGLGVHTELINDAMMQLSNAGIVTNENKTIWPHKMVGAFVY